MKKSRLLFAGLMIALLGAATFLFYNSDPALQAEDAARARRRDIYYPRNMHSYDNVAKKRPGVGAAPLDWERINEGQDVFAELQKNDPFLRAISDDGSEFGPFIFETNAIVNAPLVDKIMRCKQKEMDEGMHEFQEKLGIDPSKDLDRVALTGNNMAISGQFANLKIPDEMGTGEKYGDGATIYGDNAAGGLFARVGDSLLLVGESKDELREAIDRVEGRAPLGKPIPSSMMQGEMYGPLQKEFLLKLIEESNEPALQNLASIIDNGAVRMNINQAATLSLDLNTTDEDGAEDLSNTLRGAVSLWRQKARMDGESELAMLLEDARINTDGQKIGFDLAVPPEFILNALDCDENGNPKPGTQPARPPKPANVPVPEAAGTATETPPPVMKRQN